VTLGAFIAFVYLQTRAALYSGVDSTLAARAAQVAAATTIGGGNVQVQADTPPRIADDTWIFFFNSHGRLLDQTGPAGDVVPDRAAVRRAVQGWAGWSSGADNLRLYTSRERDDAGHLFLVQIVGSREEADRALARVLVAVGFAAPVLLLISGAGGNFLAGRTLRPIDRITRTARRIGISGLQERLALPPRNDEVGRLADTFDWMLDRLEETFQRQRQFTADASHELRTPLTILQGEVEIALLRPRRAEDYATSLRVLQGQIGHMTGLVEDLLALARADSGQADMAHEVVAFDDLVRQATLQSQSLFAAKGLSLDLAVVDELLVVGDPARLTQLVLNLLSNAARYTDRGGVRVEVRRVYGQALLEVRDSGIGIPPEQVDRIFERFYRVDKARSRAQGGSGLGLAIAQWIAQAHGGSIIAESAVGVGSTFRVMLPLAPPERQSAPD
jgi:signal transduction histidine kinase